MKFDNHWILKTLCVILTLRNVETLLFPYGIAAGDTDVSAGDDEPFRLDLTNPIVFYGTTYDHLYYVDNGVISFVDYTEYEPESTITDYTDPLVLVFHDDFENIFASLHARESTAPSDLADPLVLVFHDDFENIFASSATCKGVYHAVGFGGGLETNMGRDMSVFFYTDPLVLVFHDDFENIFASLHARESTTPSDLAQAAAYVEELFPQLAPFTPTSVVIVTWVDFSMYSASDDSITNTFQGAIVSSTDSTVVLMLYDRIITNEYSPVIGVTAGDGVQFQEHPVSRTSAVLQLDTTAQAVTTGLHGFVVQSGTSANVEKDPIVNATSVYCVRNSTDEDLVDITVSVFSIFYYYLLTLNTTAYEAELRYEVTLDACRTATPLKHAVLKFTVNVSNTDDPGCGSIYTAATGMINFTVEALQQLEFYQANDTTYRMGCSILDYKDSVDVIVGDIVKTTVPTMTGRLVSLRFQDRLDYAGSQAFSATDEVQVGRFIFPTICFFRGSPYTPDVDPYGVYVYSCQLANNPLFRNNGDDISVDLTDSNGCLVQPPVQAVVQRHNFKELSDTGSPPSPFCISTGGFPAFNWRTGESKIYMRCFVGFCRNTQLYPQSRCKDSCSYTLIDVNATDPDDKRRRRRDNTEDEPIEVLASITVKNLETDNETPLADTKSGLALSSRCIDRKFAEGVILSLVAALVLATALVLVLYFTVEVRMRPGIESVTRKSVPLPSNKP